MPTPRGRTSPDAPLEPLVTWVVDPRSEVARAEVGTVREVALAVYGEVPFEVVLTGDAESSTEVAAGVVALLAAGEYPMRAVEDALRAHTDEGLDLADADVVATIAERRGDDAEAVRIFARSVQAREMAVEDREIARAFGDPADHALYWCGDEVVRLPGPGAEPREVLEALREARRGA